MSGTSKNTSISVLNLKPNVHKMLISKGISTVEEVNELTPGQLLRTQGFGKVSLKEVVFKLKEYNNSGLYGYGDDLYILSGNSTKPIACPKCKACRSLIQIRVIHVKYQLGKCKRTPSITTNRVARSNTETGEAFYSCESCKTNLSIKEIEEFNQVTMPPRSLHE